MEEGFAERLLTHHVAGHWRAPLSQRMRDVVGASGEPIGRLVEADARDVERVVAAALSAAPSLAAASSGDRAALADRFAAALAERAPMLAAARRLERRSADPVLPAEVDLPPGLPPGAVAILGAVAAPPALVAALIGALLRAGHPVILKPAPRAPVSALVLMEAAQAAGVPAGALNLVQGGGETTGAALLCAASLGGALLAGKPEVRAPLPQAPLPVRPVPA